MSEKEKQTARDINDLIKKSEIVPQTISTRHGLMNIYYPNDFTSQCLLRHGEFEWYVIDILNKICEGQEPGIILDVGANIGCMCLPLAKKFPMHDVLAFEIQPEMLRILRENIRLNDITNISVYDFGLGSESDSITLLAPDYSNAENISAFTINPFVQQHSDMSRGTGQNITVSIRKLDDIDISRPIRCIKLDIEGYEMKVLEGAEQTLIRHGFPPIVYELWSYNRWWDDHALKIKDWLIARGYDITTTKDTGIAIQKEKR